jgi:hypothetical protein
MDPGDSMPIWAQYDPSFDVPGVDTVVRGFISDLPGNILAIFTMNNTSTAGVKQGLVTNLWSSGTNQNIRITATNGNNDQMTVTGTLSSQDAVDPPHDCNQARLDCLICYHQTQEVVGAHLAVRPAAVSASNYATP